MGSELILVPRILMSVLQCVYPEPPFTSHSSSLGLILILRLIIMLLIYEHQLFNEGKYLLLSHLHSEAYWILCIQIQRVRQFQVRSFRYVC